MNALTLGFTERAQYPILGLLRKSTASGTPCQMPDHPRTLREASKDSETLEDPHRILNPRNPSGNPSIFPKPKP